MKIYQKCFVMILGIITLMSFKQQDAEKDFINKAIEANLFEIEVAKQALQSSSNEQIKAFAQTLIDDHTILLGELQQYAATQQWDTPTAINKGHQDQLSKLQGLSSAEYNQYFKELAIESHENSIQLYKNLAQDNAIEDATLKTWVVDKLPILEGHLVHAQELIIEGDPVQAEEANS